MKKSTAIIIIALVAVCSLTVLFVTLHILPTSEDPVIEPTMQDTQMPTQEPTQTDPAITQEPTTTEQSVEVPIEDILDIREEVPDEMVDILKTEEVSNLLSSMYAGYRKFDISSVDESEVYGLTLTVANADGYIIMEKNSDGSYMKPYTSNEYGSDYSLVVFENGVPSDNLEIYDALFETGCRSSILYTDYVEGDVTATFVDNTGNTYTLDF